MKHFAYIELHNFVNRADSFEKVKIAHDFLMRQEYLSADEMEGLIDSLQQVAKEIRAETRAYDPDRWSDPYLYD